MVPRNVVPYGPSERLVAEAVRAAASEPLDSSNARISEHWEVINDVAWPEIVLSPARVREACPLRIGFRPRASGSAAAAGVWISMWVHEGIRQEQWIEAGSFEELAAFVSQVVAAVVAGRVKITALRATRHAEWSVGFECELAEGVHYRPDPGYTGAVVGEIFGRSPDGLNEMSRPACLSYDGQSAYSG